MLEFILSWAPRLRIPKLRMLCYFTEHRQLSIFVGTCGYVVTFGFGVGDDALFLRIVARVVVYCWLEYLNGYYCDHVFVFVFCFLAGSREFVMLVGSPFFWTMRDP